MVRNYISEIHQLGISYRSIASSLGISKSTAYRWSKAINKPTLPYENIRNYYRRSSYRFMREAGYPSYVSSASRRQKPMELHTERVWSNMIVDNLYQRWNKKHPSSKYLGHITKDDIRRRIEKGMRNGKSKEDIENY